MSTDIRQDWNELGERMRKQIATMESLSLIGDHIRHDDKLAGMRDGLAYYEGFAQLAQIAPHSAWNNLRDQLDAEGGEMVRGQSVDAYRQGIRNARHAMTGFNRD